MRLYLHGRDDVARRIGRNVGGLRVSRARDRLVVAALVDRGSTEVGPRDVHHGRALLVCGEVVDDIDHGAFAIEQLAYLLVRKIGGGSQHRR